MMMGKKARLSAVALGVAFGVTSALCKMLFIWMAWKAATGVDMVNQWTTIYPGLALSMPGVFVGGAWGFVEGFVFGLISGWIYNLCLCCCSKRCCCNQPGCPACSAEKRCS